MFHLNFNPFARTFRMEISSFRICFVDLRHFENENREKDERKEKKQPEKNLMMMLMKFRIDERVFKY